MISLNELHNKMSVTTGEAILASEMLAQKYIVVLTNILRIKKELPVDEEQGFRRVNNSNTELLEELQTILQDFLQEVSAVKQNLTNEHETSQGGSK